MWPTAQRRDERRLRAHRVHLRQGDQTGRCQRSGISLQYPYEGTFFRFADYRTNAVNTLSGTPSAKSISITHSASYKTSFAYNS